MKSITYGGLQIPLDRERRAEILEVKPTDRMKEFAGREDQGLSFTIRMPEQSVNRVDLLFQDEGFPGSVSVFLDPDKQGDAFAWRASFEHREDGALIFQPTVGGGELEDYLARRLHEAGLLVLRKEGRVVVGAPLFCDGKRDDKEKVRTFVRETLLFVLVKAEVERRLVYPPGTEPPKIDLPAATAAAKARARSKKKPKPPAVPPPTPGRAPLKGAPAAGAKVAPLAPRPPAPKSSVLAARLAARAPQPPAPAEKLPLAPPRAAPPVPPAKPANRGGRSGKTGAAARTVRPAPRAARAKNSKKRRPRRPKPARRALARKGRRR